MDLQKICPYFDGHPGILQWNVDFDDWENILRIVSAGVSKEEVVHILQQEGVFCKELEG